MLLYVMDMIESKGMLVLASNSPRREELLMLTGWSFRVLAKPVDEKVLPEDEPDIYVERTATRKAEAAVEALAFRPGGERVVIACDTAVYDGRRILGKPVDREDAVEMLRNLRGRIHQVYSGLVVIDLLDGSAYKDTCITEVPMREYSEDEMMDYISSGDPMDKAGAYAIQHNQFCPVIDLSGCYANVMGLPLCHLTRLMVNLNIMPEITVPEACQAYLKYNCQIFQSIMETEMRS